MVRKNDRTRTHKTNICIHIHSLTLSLARSPNKQHEFVIIKYHIFPYNISLSDCCWWRRRQCSFKILMGYCYYFYFLIFFSLHIQMWKKTYYFAHTLCSLILTNAFYYNIFWTIPFSSCCVFFFLVFPLYFSVFVLLVPYEYWPFDLFLF